MLAQIIVAILSFAGTAIGTLGGIIASAKLTNYRIQQLEKRVEEHNKFARRLPVLEEKISVANNRIADLEQVVGMTKPIV